MIKDFLIISDSKNSAISTSSRQWKKILGGEIVYCTDFYSPIQLLKAVGKKKPNTILFAWRGALSEILKDSNSTNYFNQNLSSSRVLFSVPDHMGLKFRSREIELLNFADGATVVSEKLFVEYSKMCRGETPILVLRDLPDLDLIKKTNQSIDLKKNQVIWVGNSRWGEKLGYFDHKGYKRFIKPIFLRLKKIDPGLETVVIDRGKNFIPLDQTLEEIRLSKFLFQFSDSEGTGMPIIEACGLGTIPITTDVGIAREILSGGLENLIVKNTDEALKRFSELKNQEMKEALMNSYNDYVEACKASINSIKFDRLSIRATRRHNYVIESNLKMSFKVRLRWIYRYLRNKGKV
jgi:glycosyltransferase involved in cell wall biosynthesis